MSANFEELDFRPTAIGTLSLRRRRQLSTGIDIFEIKLGDEWCSIAKPGTRRFDQASRQYAATICGLSVYGMAACGAKRPFTRGIRRWAHRGS
jgi:hypothetical protein